MKKSLPFIIIGVVLVGGIAAFLLLSKKGQDGGASNNVFATPQPGATATTQTAQQPPVGDTGLVRPNVKVSSPVLLEEYGDYQCPPCGMLFPELKKIEAEYGDQVRFVFRHFPLEKMHRNALAAAHAAEAARLQGKFRQMHDLLYTNQNAWKDMPDPRTAFIAYARELGMNAERFVADMESPRVDQIVRADFQRGQSVGVTGTPTVFIEGHQLPYEATTLDGIRRGINIMLQRKAT
ncbi:MAG TPA: thioredoxin domain-containing protein [Pyrinomonadaceae bacterium]|nr:thioredoxin domain-containing protein [Pyrinomonadaceae bacterium]